MAPTPPMADAAPTAASSPSHDERTRRNVACVNCRNSKVRCKSSRLPGQPCQRCAKMQISCVVDKAHKRITKRSKLEQLEQELRSIQQVVNNTKTNESSWTPPSPRAALSASSELPPLSVALRVPPPPSQTRAPHQEPVAVPGGYVQRPERQQKTGPTETRMLGNHVISGEDVDYYFNKYIQHFHPFLPILRKKDPDECFEASPMLFWVILYVTCRRYAKDSRLLATLVEHVSKNIWTVISSPVIGIEVIHAILIICAWPYPTIRFVTDPSTMFASIASNACMMLGLHTGRGSHNQFCIGLRAQIVSTDEEAASTWAACCLLAQKTSASSGHPPPNIQYNDARCKTSLASSFWADLLTTYDFQKFLNRAHTAMFAQVSITGSISEHLVAMWENELETLKPVIVQYDTEMSRFLLLAAQFEIQLYYFMAPSGIPNPNLRINTFKTFNTARSIILTALDFETRCKFITHGPCLVIRSIIDAANALIYLLHSLCSPDIPPHDANVLAQQAYGAIMRCSVREADLPYRASTILETFWACRSFVPKFESVPSSWVMRGGAGLTYATLDKFKDALLTAQRSTDGVNKAIEIMQPNRADLNTGVVAATPVSQDQPGNNVQLPPQQQQQLNDPFQDVDWSMFMDDFGWVGNDGVLLSLI